ncbi:MAG: CocE/NonD family hydrolase [Actinobacteria bacterium]|nr:CocE/NonD family hydrolase [Actinomycetota bacterium]
MSRIGEIVVQSDVPAVMRDGTALMSNVYRPASGGPYPVLLTRLPYGKDLSADTTYFDPMKAARRCYLVVVQDVRGRYASEGKFTPFVREIEDGHDSVEWAAKLPGSSGSVGMFGLSYFGKTQWHAAVAQPPSLRSMAPGQTWGNHLNGAQMRGGAQELGLMQYWAQTALALGVLFRRYRGEPEMIEEKLPTLVGSIDTLLAGGGYDALPLADLPDPDDLTPFVRGGFARSVDSAQERRGCDRRACSWARGPTETLVARSGTWTSASAARGCS